MNNNGRVFVYAVIKPVISGILNNAVQPIEARSITWYTPISPSDELNVRQGTDFALVCNVNDSNVDGIQAGTFDHANRETSAGLDKKVVNDGMAGGTHRIVITEHHNDATLLLPSHSPKVVGSRG